jgi:GntR family transcriptional regulator, carbon starvation induced regulator
MAALTTENPLPSGKTVLSTAYDRLREDIMRGVLAPGQKLKFNTLTEAYGVGMGTLREVLHKLAADGLVEAEERRGFTVEAVGVEQVIDAASVRILLEEEGLRRSIQFGDVEWEVAVLGTYRRLESCSEALARKPHIINDQWQASHRDFHRALVSACRSPMLLDFRDIMFARWERYARLSLSTELHDVAVTINNTTEHRAIKDAALARDADRAASLLRKHFEGTRELLLNWIEKRRPKTAVSKRRSAKSERD